MTIRAGDRQGLSVRLVDMRGQLQTLQPVDRRSIVGGQQLEFDTENLPAGTYCAEIARDDGLQTQSVIKAK